jgi:acetoacetyl-CoA synthetase
MAKLQKMNMQNPLWSPSSDYKEKTLLKKFMRAVHQNSYEDLHAWSIENPEKFWSEVWDFCGILGDKKEPYLTNEAKMEQATFFPQAHLNYAENLLRRRDQETAIVFWGEDQVKRSLTFKQLYDAVSRLAQAMRTFGIQSGDRVAGYVPNTPEAVIAMLATATLGAIWSSCSPDFGVTGILDRFGQIEPKILFAADCYVYKSKIHSCLEKLAEIQKSLPSLQQTIVFSYEGTPSVDAPLPKTTSWNDFLKPFPADEIEFQRFPFNTPLFIMFSSGTTGVPKCIVHGAGGTLIQHMKEHQLHCNLKSRDRLFYFTTCGWMMWNWQVSGLASGLTLLLYDGSPFAPSPTILFDYTEQEKMTLFGISAKYIDSLRKENISPTKTHDLSSLKILTSTGSPLVPESFDSIYEHIKKDLCVASISGGTDIISCFVLGNPMAPVWRGEIQAPGLGMAVDIFDDNGHSLQGEKGELVCTKPFPSMPLGFWRDPQGTKYHDSYFSRFPNIWCHGDFAERTEHGGFIIYGRSDAVLNPGGVRIGTAEIYRQVEKIDEVLESIAIGQDYNNDVRIILFVKLKAGVSLDEALKYKIKQQIRTHTTPRHVPEVIIQVPDIPRTKNNKLVELAVREVVHGRPVHNIEALANPEALEYFKDLEELR